MITVHLACTNPDGNTRPLTSNAGTTSFSGTTRSSCICLDDYVESVACSMEISLFHRPYPYPLLLVNVIDDGSILQSSSCLGKH